MIENVALFVTLMVLGVGATMAVLVCLIYFLEIQDD
jgi:Na+-transporting methylmalonyl-CoA/oxaloacetate decarboxylase gamma subunit